MLPQMPQEMLDAQAQGISFFAGEAEGGRLDKVLSDAWNGIWRPLSQRHGRLAAGGRRACAKVLRPGFASGDALRLRVESNVAMQPET